MGDSSLTHRLAQTRVRSMNAIAVLRNARSHNAGALMVSGHPMCQS